jgi:hypothetical protein
VGGTIRFPDVPTPDSLLAPTLRATTTVAARGSTAAPGPAAIPARSDSAASDSGSTDTSSSDASTSHTGAFDDGVVESAAACEATRAMRGRAAAKSYANTLVWIANVKTGKALPIEKRADLSSERCLLDPRVQGVVVGTTVNIVNDDKLLHKLIYTKLGTHDTLTITPFFNAGQMVASERLAKTPGIVEVRCVQHPWTRGYIAVFAHPYFAVTENNGSFKIDSLPPGTYKMMVWREGMSKPMEQQIQVTAGGLAKVDLTMK